MDAVSLVIAIIGLLIAIAALVIYFVRPGPTGRPGLNGPQGTQGTVGTASESGPQGYQGTQGDDGPQGYQGPEGSQGAQGPQGPSLGPVGTQGPQGPQGQIGGKGLPGPVGPAAAYYNQIHIIPDDASTTILYGGFNNYIYCTAGGGDITMVNLENGPPTVGSGYYIAGGIDHVQRLRSPLSTRPPFNIVTAGSDPKPIVDVELNLRNTSYKLTYLGDYYNYMVSPAKLTPYTWSLQALESIPE